MDEFELFRAQAYSGGVTSNVLSADYAASSSSGHLFHEASATSNARRRRHSAVALTHSAAASMSGAAERPPAQPGQPKQVRERRRRLAAGGSAQGHQSLDYSGYDVRDAVVANVTVAIEPPSPTETRRHQFITAPASAASSSAVAEASSTELPGQTVDNYDDYDSADVVCSEVKLRSSPREKSPLRRRVTSPEAVMAAVPQPEVTSSGGGEPGPAGDGTGACRLAVSGSSSGQQLRRTSICSVSSNSLQPTAANTGSPRRNSCTGLVQSSNGSPIAAPRPSSRRNSAVTYLPDMPQARTRSAPFDYCLFFF